MVTFDVCWIEGIADIRRVAGVQMAELPRRGDWIDLEYLPDEMFKQAFKGEELARSCVFNRIRIQTSKPEFSVDYGWTENDVRLLREAADDVFAEIEQQAAAYRRLADDAWDAAE